MVPYIQFPEKKTHKIAYVSASTWRYIFLIQTNDLYWSQERTFYDRSSTIPPFLGDTRIDIYNGRGITKRYVYPQMTGFKVGAFTWNRKLALYKAKQLRKKAQKKAKQSSQQTLQTKKR